MKKLGLSICAFLMLQLGYSQEMTLPALSQYLSDSEFLIAPTFAGIGNNVRIRASLVSQWVGLEDAPDYQSLSGDMRLGDRSGLGAMLYNDKNGYTRQMGGKFTFSHHLTLDAHDNHFLSFGISYRVNSFRIDIDKFATPTSPLIDPAVTDNRSNVNHNFEVGVLYRYKRIFASLSASNILNKNKDVFTRLEPTNLRNYNLFAGYRYRRTRTSSLELEPSIFAQYIESDGRSVVDLNFKARWFDFEDYYWVGVTYRSIGDQSMSPLSVGPMLGLKRGLFYFAYGYQVTLNELMNINSGTHLLTVGIDLFQGIGGCNCTEKL